MLSSMNFTNTWETLYSPSSSFDSSNKRDLFGMVMIKTLTHRGPCHAGGTLPALGSLGRYFASLLFNQSAILILQLQTVVCGFAQLTPGFPCAGLEGEGVLRSWAVGRESPRAFRSQGAPLPAPGTEGEERQPPGCLGPEPIDPRLGRVSPWGRLLALQGSRAFHGKAAKSFAKVFQVQPPA